MRLLATVFIGLLCCASRVRAADDAAPPLFELRTADGAVQAGPLAALSASYEARLGGAKPIRAQGPELISIRRASPLLPPFPRVDQEQVLLANGSRIAGHIVALADDRIQFQPALDRPEARAGRLRLPISTVAVMWLAAPRRIGKPDTWLRNILRTERASDVLWLRNGDRVEGTLLGISASDVRIKTREKKETVLRRETLAVVALSTELLSRARPKGIHAQLTLANGSRLLVAEAALAEGATSIRAKLPAGGAFEIPIEELVSLDTRNGCARYLSDMKPVAYEHTPFFGVRWTYEADASVSGEDLRIAGATYAKGLGMHSQSRLTYELPASARAFEAIVGLDDRRGRHGRARAQVLLDGKAVELAKGQESVQLAASAGAKSIRIAIKNAKSLTLVVSFADRGDVQGRVNWGEARIILDKK